MKKQALAKFLEVAENEITLEFDVFQHGSEEYLVLTEEEAEEEVKEEIKNSLWAFNADFIIRHCRNYKEMTTWEYNSAIESLQEAQKTQCESLNGLAYALIDNFDEFVEDAINADGRGHFIAFYDGIEHEQKIDDEWFYIYRIN